MQPLLGFVQLPLLNQLGNAGKFSARGRLSTGNTARKAKPDSESYARMRENLPSPARAQSLRRDILALPSDHCNPLLQILAHTRQTN